MEQIQFLKLVQFVLHYGGHFLLPGLLAWVFVRKDWKKIWLIMAMTILVDLDHLFATPIFDATRCSIGYHYLHTKPAICCYFVLSFFPKTRWIALGLLLHMLIDYQDCLWNGYIFALKNSNM